MKRLYGIPVFIFLWLIGFNPAWAQEDDKEESNTIEKEVKITINEENGDQQYTVETITSKNGQKKVIKKSYGSFEEMKADSTIDIFSTLGKVGDITINLGDKDTGTFEFSNENGETFDIKMDEITEDMKWISESDQEGHKIIKSSAGKMIIIKDDDEDMTLHEGNSEDMLAWVDKKGNKSISKSISKKIVKPSISTATVETIDLDDAEFSSFNLAGMPELVLKSLNYYPNPSEGEFTLAFSGAKKPVIIRILDVKGNLMLEKNIPEFSGTYNEVINVKSFNKGDYLLQIFQRDKVLNRKLILK